VCDLIPVQPKPEPASFDKDIRTPGGQFIRQHPHPTGVQWRRNRHWKKCILDLYRSYGGICAYSAIWVPRSGATVDHYVPISHDPRIAYEWSNYRLSCEKANGNKGDSRNVLDPFKIMQDSFTIDFPSLLVKPGSSLNPKDRARVEKTIEILQLNEEYFVEDRIHWLTEYTQNSDMDFLRRYAPFIAYELQRQQLSSNISSMMQFP